MPLHTLTREEWTACLQRKLLADGFTGDTACETAHGLAEIFDWQNLTPQQAIDRCKACSETAKIHPNATSRRITHL